VEILRRGPLSRDVEFHARYRLTTHGTRFAIAMGVAGAVIALLALATTLLNWSW
jgi:hypothetical protein